ncbi:hypothetical protein CANCADRAFT_85001 [Tortispora caseinolytica NRRL Y-17796]|uniref:tRNA(His) guanylyltransferase n=1 Tax=Tortispora caseinolytica NRRL Y-17796 TaxID=767744 RepID=A0A1E4TKS5_9ASCO|nr:hypothetical protein CANCADRAFT_85001 [Tortispora caseinolytica NRRL Y-17796]
MANSRFEYVKSYERDDSLLPGTYIVVRIDGRGFHRLSKRYEFTKPNDLRALELMNESAASVMNQISDIVLAYGDSDEYSFVFKRSTQFFGRRECKLVSTVCSVFTACYVYSWSKHFACALESDMLPSFDSRAVLYPSSKELRDYLSWRQADCHINNLYNTTFWALVLKKGLSEKDANKALEGTFSSDKNELLFSEFGINYNNEPEIFRKGTVLVKTQPVQSIENTMSERQKARATHKNAKIEIEQLHCDIIGNDFWEERAYILE